jgi:hypothetical protein
MKVLVLHEERTTSDYLCNLLRTHGYETLPLYSSAEAFDHLFPIQFDVALLSTSASITESLAILFEEPVIQPRCRVILFGFHDEVESMRDRKPEFEYLEAPFGEEKLIGLLQNFEAAAVPYTDTQGNAVNDGGISMNQKQRACLIAGFILLVVAAVFPPWRLRYSSFSYGFLFKPPSAAISLQIGPLLVEWLLVTLVTGGAFLILKNSQTAKLEGESLATLKRNLTRTLMIPVAVACILSLAGFGYYKSFRAARDLRSDDLNKVTGMASLTNYGSMELDAYNGSEFVLTEISVSISVLNVQGQVLISNRMYRLYPHLSDGLNPQSTGRFTAPVGFVLEEGQTWHFTIASARGRPE